MNMPQRNFPGAVVLGSDFKALGVVRSLGKRGIPIVVIDNIPRSAWFSRYVKKRLKWHGSMDEDTFLSFLLNIGKTYHLEQWVLFPMQDEVVEFVARHHQELGLIYQLGTQPWEIVRWANDKRMTYQMAQTVGVPYPTTWYPQNVDDIKSLEITFPAIIKPTVSTRLQYALRIKALPAYNYDELVKQYNIAASVMKPEEIMIQQIIPGTGITQFSVAAYCKDGQMIVNMTARRTRQYPIDYGLGSSFVEAIEVPFITEYAQKLLQSMNVTGMAEVEFKFDERDQQYKLLDINLRPWGWHTLCIACGIDFPYIQYCDVLGETPAPITPRYGYHWIRLLTDILAGVQEVRAGITTPGAYLRSLKGRAVYSVLDINDPIPVFGDTFIAFSRLIKRFPAKGAKEHG